MTTKQLLLPIAGFMLLTLLPSCSDDNTSFDSLRPTALVTVCPDDDGSFIMQLDNSTRLLPVNMKSSPFGTKEVRALVNYTETETKTKEKATRNVQVNWIDSIRTKLPVESLGDQDDAIYGSDPIEIINDWVTVAEDGYLTLRIRTLWGTPRTAHVLNLVTGTNPENPYDLELRHDAKGDCEGRWGDALIAFNLNHLPKTDSGTATINLKWKSFSGEKSAHFELQMRPATQEFNTGSILYSGLIE